MICADTTIADVRELIAEGKLVVTCGRPVNHKGNCEMTFVWNKQKIKVAAIS